MLLILGLDGATLDLAGPWAADGTMPHLARLMETGAWGRLASTVPPVTFPSWTTFMTGVNPGRHGIFDFTRREGGSYRVRFVNSTHRKAPSVWRLLSDAGRRVSVLGLPGTYPPEPINGCMVSGFDTPVTTRADRSFVHPPEFADDVERLGGFPFADFQEFAIGAGWHEKALASLLEGIDRKGRLAEELLARESWDCLMLLFGESDTAAHHFWTFHDPASPRFDAQGARRLGDPVRAVYQALDRWIGRFADAFPSATILVVSDHGFGGSGDTALYLNRWLAERGHLSWKPRAAHARLAAGLRTAALRLVPERLQARCFRFADGRLASRVESGVRFGGIDWQGTSAFSEELNYFPSVWLNVRGRDEAGRVAPGDYERVRDAIVADLREWKDPLNGIAVVRRVWKREELYRGAHVESAPDLLLDLATPGGYSYVCLPSRGEPGPTIERLAGEALRGGKLRGMSGSHRADGLFALSGPGVRAGELSGAQIADMAPTILALNAVSVPRDWDGHALECLPRRRDDDECAPVQRHETERSYPEADEAALSERFTQLGYFE